MLKRFGFKLCICFVSLSLLPACGGEDSSSGNGGTPEPASLTQDQRYDLLYRSTFGPQPNGVVDQIGLKTNDAICDSPLVSNRHT